MTQNMNAPPAPAGKPAPRRRGRKPTPAEAQQIEACRRAVALAGQLHALDIARYTGAHPDDARQILTNYRRMGASLYA